jgi:Zn-dependent oligopeptidase
VFPILNTCTVERTRKAVEVAFNRRCVDSNVAILEEMLELRNNVALALGYENHAAYVLEQRYRRSWLCVLCASREELD